MKENEVFRESSGPVQNCTGISLHFTRFLLLNLLSCCGSEHAKYVTVPDTLTSLFGNEHYRLGQDI